MRRMFNEYYVDIKNLLKTRKSPEALLFLLLYVSDFFFDILLNVRTLGTQKSSEDESRNIFRSSRYLPFIIFLRSEHLENQKILDIGSGKGRVLLLLSYLGAKEVCGVEDDEVLYNKSIENMTRFERRFGQAKVNIKKENFFNLKCLNQYDTFYLFDPFSSEVLSKAINKIKKDKENNFFRIIYHDNFITDEKENVLSQIGTVFKKRILSHDYFVVEAD